ncbi:MAG: UbiA family prenyltransferase [Bacteroidota bacterium]|nr:UbiA family prenyltransferase [Bacteroidota bacterium]
MLIKKITEFALFSSIFIACCAVALAIETNLLLRTPLNNLSFYFFVFGATMVQYNLHYLVKTSAVKNSRRLAWSLQNKAVHKILFAAGCFLIIISLFSFRLQHFFILLVLGAIALLYSFPALPFAKGKRIKDFGFLKILTLALLWTLVTVWFPVSDMAVNSISFLFVFGKRFTFMFVLCLLFDMRDIEIDRHENIKTLAVILGKKKSYFTAYAGLLLFLLICLFQYFYWGDTGLFIAMCISAAATLLTVEFTKKTNSDFVYLAGIDGMMLLQALLVYLLALKL